MAVSGILTNIFEMTSSTDVVTENMHLASVRWQGATSSTAVCVATDLKGNVLFRSYSNGANFIDGWVFGKKSVDGVKFTTMDSGIVTWYKAV